MGISSATRLYSKGAACLRGGRQAARRFAVGNGERDRRRGQGKRAVPDSESPFFSAHLLV